MSYRILFPFIATAMLAVSCDAGVASKEEAAQAQKSGAPTKSNSAPVPSESNTLPPPPPAHPPADWAAGAPKSAPEALPHPPMGAPGDAPAVKAGSIKVAAGGVTIKDLFERRAVLAGKTVKVRGKVVKVTEGVMGANWYHLQDGTGAAGTNDLTVTSDGNAKVGDLVVISGTLATDKDFGMGYRYEAIVEKATLTAE